ncbi:MAG: tagA [Friedmanniella sp.]|nr:tagA [Friedmanniella sp.]
MATLRPPAHVDRLIVHQFDPARPSPGGIDSCLRGICRYLPPGHKVAIVGVDTGAPRPGRRVGQWEYYDSFGDRPFWFLPVVSLDPADQKRRVPHALRLIRGVLRFRDQLPRTTVVQVHRMDSALALRQMIHRPQVYFIHTQENGLTGKTSDSFWRYAGQAHQWFEKSVVRRARQVVVFNEAYAELVRDWNPKAVFSPTWYDPQLITGEGRRRDPHRIVWVGRMEVPKDPELAVEAFARLVRTDPSSPWTLDLLGTGTLMDRVRERVAVLPDNISSRIRLLGRVAPAEVARIMSEAGLFLMTSHPGYEGYARVLVESMASGLPAVVTDGSDTGGLVVNGRTGYVCGRDPDELAGRLRDAAQLDRHTVRGAVADLDAPTLIGRLLTLEDPIRNEVLL